MAKAKTAVFFIRRSVDLSAGAPVALTIDTSAYVDPADRQGLMIEEVDYVFYDNSTNLPIQTTNKKIAVQLLSGDYTALQAYDEEDLVSSAGLVFDGQSGASQATDIYPDALATPGGRIVVDDSMTLVGDASAAITNLSAAVLIKAKVVTLSNKDYMALALQTVAN